MYPKTCPKCGVEFQTTNFRQQKCKPDCGRIRDGHRNEAREAKANAHEVEFLAVDGEGIDTEESRLVWDDEECTMVSKRVPTHHYVQLAVGDETLHNNGEELRHPEIFQFLYDQFKENPKAAFVGFYLNYDFTNWLKSITDYKSWLLLHKAGIAKRTPPPREDGPRFPWPVRCDGWEFDILGAKRFKLRPYIARSEWPECTVNHKTPELIAECIQGGHKRNPFQWMYICDAGPFFQSSLMVAINPKSWQTPIVSDREYAVLEQGKRHRGCSEKWCSEGLPKGECPGVFGPAMIRYNTLENNVLVRLMDQVNQGFVADNIRLTKQQWMGPGQAAQAWMKLIGVPTGDTVRETVPKWALDAARDSYFGGWFEIAMHGIIPGTTYAYDINSAYPWIISQLPCLLHGDWTRGTGKPPRIRNGVIRLVNARVRGRDYYIGAMPHRDRHGNIVRPGKTAGWYWWHELEAARRAGLVSGVTVDEWVEYRPCACKPPMASIADLYEGRLKAGKDSPFGKSKKLVYNSSYGKLAQSIGKPRFSNSIYASLITAGCRTMILDAIATHPKKSQAVAMIATDGIFFLEPHPTLPISKTELGKWDVKEHENLSLMMPGLYWDDASRAMIREGKAPKVKSRGVPAKDLAKFVDEIDSQWRWLMTKPENRDWTWPEVSIPIAFGMVSAKLAASQDRWHDCGRVEHDKPRVLNANPHTKRMSAYFWPDQDTGPIIRSYVWPDVDDEPHSTPYDKAFGDDERPWNEADEQDLITPDGTVTAAIRAVIPRD
jgi:hypothetical protein